MMGAKGGGKGGKGGGKGGMDPAEMKEMDNMWKYLDNLSATNPEVSRDWCWVESSLLAPPWLTCIVRWPSWRHVSHAKEWGVS